MKRLTHSFQGYLNYTRISEKKIFVFVEGKIPDPYFYEGILKTEFGDQREYEIVRACELNPNNNSGGKKIILDFYLFLKRKNALFKNYNGSKKIFLFFLDKDIDDILELIKNDDHIIYTKYYDIENHIFLEGDILKAISLATSLDFNRLNAIIKNSHSWLDSIKLNHKEWIKMCVYSAVKKIQSGCSYRRNSIINIPIYSSADQDKVEENLKRLQHKSSLTKKGFRISYKKVTKVVEEIYENDCVDYIFRGKWYPYILASELKDRIDPNIIDSNNLPNRLLISVLSTIDFNHPWIEHFTKKIKNIKVLLN